MKVISNHSQTVALDPDNKTELGQKIVIKKVKKTNSDNEPQIKGSLFGFKDIENINRISWKLV